VQKCARCMMSFSVVTRGSILTVITTLAVGIVVDLKGNLVPKGPRAARLTVMLRAPSDQDTCIRLPGQGAMSTPGARGLGGEERRAA
jgi:hypothetical protein